MSLFIKGELIVMKSLKDVILYLTNGISEIPTMSYFDDKNASDEEKAKDKAIGEYTGTIRISNIDADIESHLRKAELRKRSLCFYPNGYMRKENIKEINWHFVDIDEGDKEEQFERIMSAPLKPTLVYRGRAGHKFLYRVKDALWDKTTKESLDASVNYFKNIQLQLIEYFLADKNLVAPNYPLRLPFTKNYKYWREEIVEEAIVLFDSNNVYSQKELSDAFPPAKEKHIVRETVTFEEYPNEIQKILETTVFCFETNDIDYIDRGDRLSFQCPVHDDSNSSAYMFKDNLMCFCSRGAADGGCEIGKGKPLGRVAEYLGWDDLKVLCDNITGLSERKYLNINLDGMSAINLVTLNEELSHNVSHVNSIILRIEETMANRGIQVDEQTRQVYKGILGKFLSDKNAITVGPLEPGGGKSTLMEIFLMYMLENDISNAGCVVVVERIETAQKLAEQLGIYRTYMEVSDVPFWGPNKSAYVMESAFTYKRCKKKLISYEYGICRGCSERMTCPIPKKHHEQMKHPIVVITHARLKMESQNLGNYSKWRNIDGKEYKRNLIIIDEKPPLIEVSSLKLKDYDRFLYEVNSMGFDIDDAKLEATKEI